MRIVLIGAPGSGKGTQAKLLEERFDYAHINMGEILRNSQSHKIHGDRIKRLIYTGNLLPDDIVEDLLRDAVDGTKNDKIVFDGFPRNESQLRVLKRIATPDLLISLYTPTPEKLYERLITRNRPDDTEEIHRNRISTFYAETTQMIRHIVQAGMNIRTLAADNEIEIIHTEIRKLIGERHND